MTYDISPTPEETQNRYFISRQVRPILYIVANQVTLPLLVDLG